MYIIFVFTVTVAAQETHIIRGEVLYRNVGVVGQNVINVTSEKATITNKNGEFTIPAKIGDILAFTAVNYELKTVKITQQILDKGRLVVEVKEKVTELDEVVVTPENQEKFLDAQQERFKKVFYETDRSTQVENYALPQSERGMQYGVNFVNIFKAIFKSNKEGDNINKTIKPSNVLRQLYDDVFFVYYLKIPQANINDFLFYCDTKFDDNKLFKKDSEFFLIDFLVTESKNYLKTLNTGN